MGIKYNFDYVHRKELRNHVIEMFQIAKNTYSCISYACCLMLMYEYLIAFHFGNRDILVDDKVILKTFEHAGDNHKVLKLYEKLEMLLLIILNHHVVILLLEVQLIFTTLI